MLLAVCILLNGYQVYLYGMIRSKKGHMLYKNKSNNKRQFHAIIYNEQKVSDNITYIESCKYTSLYLL